MSQVILVLSFMWIKKGFVPPLSWCCSVIMVLLGCSILGKKNVNVNVSGEKYACKLQPSRF